MARQKYKEELKEASLDNDVQNKDGVKIFKNEVLNEEHEEELRT